MEINEYQREAMKTCTKESFSLQYLVAGLASEAGEVTGKYAKYIRNDYDLDTMSVKMAHEIGDVLWFCAVLARRLGLDLESVMRNNLQKLQARQYNNTIKGDGDNR